MHKADSNVKEEVTNPEYSTSSSNENQTEFTKKKRKIKRTHAGFSKSEEDRILKYALKMSKVEYEQKKQMTFKSFSEIHPVLEIKATPQDFINPINFFDKLWKENESSTGIIKIIPPSNWVEFQRGLLNKVYLPRLLDKEKKLYTRKQILNQLYQAKSFVHSKTYNMEEYKAIGEKLFEDLFSSDKSVNLESIEEKYWSLSADDQKTLSVLYAADIPMINYFTSNELSKMTDQNNNDFSLLNINCTQDSLLQFTKQNPTSQISGITVPWFYYGMIYSTFCWHTEDLYMYSLNYNHEGAAKIWYSIDHKDKEKMDTYIKRKYYATLLKEPNLIHKLTVHISPLELMENGIKVYKAVQNPGELILTLPKGYHCGFSSGLNLGEAVNFATLSWLRLGYEAQEEYRKGNKKLPVFSLDWIVMRNYERKDTDGLFRMSSKFKTIKDHLRRILQDELGLRTSIETFFAIHKINFVTKEIDGDSNVEFICDMCTYFAFFSHLQCRNCNKKGCINHSIQCKCLPTDFLLTYRYSSSVR